MQMSGIRTPKFPDITPLIRITSTLMPTFRSLRAQGQGADQSCDFLGAAASPLILSEHGAKRRAQSKDRISSRTRGSRVLRLRRERGCSRQRAAAQRELRVSGMTLTLRLRVRAQIRGSDFLSAQPPPRSS